MWHLKCDTNGPIYETERVMDIENRFVVANGEEVGPRWSTSLG